MNYPLGHCDICGEDETPLTFQAQSRDRKHCYKCDRKRKEQNKKDKLWIVPRLQTFRREMANLEWSEKPVARAYKPLKRTPLPKATKPIKRSPTTHLCNKRKLDKEVNAYIWSTRAHACYECGRGLVPHKNPPKDWFSHILSKGAHPELRFDPQNIVLHCRRCHGLWEFGGNREEMTTYKLKLPYMESKGYIPKDLK